MSWWRRVLRGWRHERRALAALAALILVTISVEALKPWPLKVLVDDVLRADGHAPTAYLADLPGAASRAGQAAWLSGATVFLVTLAALANVLQRRTAARVGAHVTYRLAGEAFDHLQRLSLGFHRSHSAGDLVQRVTADSTCAQELLTGVALPALTSLISLVVMFIIMLRLDPVLAFVAMAAAFPILVLVRAFMRPMTERSYKQAELEGELVALAEQTLTALPVVQAFNREDLEQRRFRSLSDRAVRAFLGATVSQLQFTVASSTVTAVGTSAVMMIGGVHVLEGRLAVGELLVFMSYLASLYAPMETLAAVITAVATVRAKGRRLEGVLDVPLDITDEPAAVALSRRPTGRVTFDHVTYGYAAGRPALHDVTLDVSPGETVAVIGRTGAGKSTLLSLVGRLIDPWSGRVLLDGVDIRQIPLSDLRANVAYVLQDPFLCAGTLRENIAYGRPDADDADIERVAAAARVSDFVGRLPGGYDTVIGERGTTLSGGERQRVAIARALLLDAPVLVLDEPTAALDAQTESSVMKALNTLKQDRTTLVIAHRLSTVRDADRIAVLEGGRIVELGPPDALLVRGGVYKHMHDTSVGTTSSSSALSPAARWARYVRRAVGSHPVRSWGRRLTPHRAADLAPQKGS